MHWIVVAIGIIAIELMLFGWILYAHGERLHTIDEELVELHMQIAAIAAALLERPK